MSPNLKKVITNTVEWIKAHFVSLTCWLYSTRRQYFSRSFIKTLMPKKKRKSPFVRRKKYEALETEATRTRYANEGLREENKRLLYDLEKLADKINLYRVYIEKQPELRKFRIVTEFDEATVHNFLDWGNDKAMIDQLGRMIGAKAAYEIRCANFARYEHRRVSV
jgi:hypothetical protein